MILSISDRHKWVSGRGLCQILYKNKFRYRGNPHKVDLHVPASSICRDYAEAQEALYTLFYLYGLVCWQICCLFWRARYDSADKFMYASSKGGSTVSVIFNQFNSIWSVRGINNCYGWVSTCFCVHVWLWECAYIVTYEITKIVCNDYVSIDDNNAKCLTASGVSLV